MVRDFISTDKYILVNGTNKVVNGPFTRYDPSDPKCKNKKSCLDLAIISKDLLKYLVKLVVDNNLKLTPCRPLSKSKVVYPDHYSLILSFKDIPLKANQIKITPKFTIWNTNKTGGWESYKDLTENNAKLMEVAEDIITNDPDKMMKTIDTELNKVKFVSFGKVKVRQKKKSLDILES